MYTGQKAIKFGRKLVVRAAPTLGLASGFAITESSVFGAEEVKYDAQQRRESMSMPINRGGGARRRASDSYQEVTEKPPYINESTPINLGDLKGRAAGNTEYDPANVEHVSRLLSMVEDKYMLIQDTIDRQIEFQAAEIYQKGKIEYSQFASPKVPIPVADYDFKMNTDLFALAAPLWAAATGKEMRAQLQTLADNIRKYGKVAPTDIIFGRTANNLFWEQAENLALLDNRRSEMGERRPQPLASDGFAFQGTIIIGANTFRCWLYEGRFENPETLELDFYIKADKVIMIAEGAERERLHAGVDIVKPTDAEVLQLFPGGVTLDAITDRVPAIQIPWAYTDRSAATTEIGIATSPLLLPKNRGGHGCLTTA